MSKRLAELREMRGQAIHNMRDLVNRSEAAGEKSLSNDDQAVYDKWFNEQDTLKNQIEAEEKLQNLEREAISKQEKHEAPINVLTNEEREIKAFGQFLKNGVNGVSHDLRNALTFDTDSEGGYLAAPQQFVAQLIQAVDDQVFMRQIGNVLPALTGAHSLGAPSLENDPADSDWTAEITAVTEDSTMDFGKRELQPHLMSKLLKVSMKLLSNSAMSAESIVAERLAYKVAVTAEKGYMTGSGANQPLGIFTASALGISTSRDISTGNTTTSITADGLREAKYGVKGQYMNTGSWVFHRDALKQISKLKDGEGQYLWQAGITNADPDTLLGRPFYMSEYAPNTFTTGLYVGMFGDFSKYWIVDSMSMTIQRLNELYAATNQVGFISRMESDGAPVLEEAFARVKLA